MKVDAHTHIISRAFMEAAERLPGAKASTAGGWHAIERDGRRIERVETAWLEPDHRLRDMDKKGVDIHLVSLSAPSLNPFPAKDHPELAKRVNDEIIALVKQRPDRMRALLTLPLTDIEASLKELERCRGAAEVCGISMGSNVGGVTPSDARFEPIWARINELKMPVVEHPMFPAFRDSLPEYGLDLILGFYFDTQIMVTRMILNGVFARYPDFPFLVAHTGAGLLGIMPRLGRVHRHAPVVAEHMKGKAFADYAKNLYYDTCVFYGPTLMEACRFAGPERLMFGTDYPYVEQDSGHVDGLDLPAKTREAINGGNAARVFGLK
jgi:aminocarboxymuconate-semialdehyde decarboxylase